MSKHTPGPWTTDGKHIHAPDGSVVAYVTEYAKPTPRQFANSNVLAAAPDLLQAIRRLQDAYTNSCSPETRADCWKQVRAAIAKAEGA